MNKVPDFVVNIIRWIIYSCISFLLLLPFFDGDIAKKICGALILGWFFAVGNEITTQLKGFVELLSQIIQLLNNNKK
jgi:hypothetical protein